jgi:hypothetical protein
MVGKDGGQPLKDEISASIGCSCFRTVRSVSSPCLSRASNRLTAALVPSDALSHLSLRYSGRLPHQVSHPRPFPLTLATLPEFFPTHPQPLAQRLQHCLLVQANSVVPRRDIFRPAAFTQPGIVPVFDLSLEHPPTQRSAYFIIPTNSSFASTSPASTYCR